MKTLILIATGVAVAFLTGCCAPYGGRGYYRPPAHFAGGYYHPMPVYHPAPGHWH